MRKLAPLFALVSITALVGCTGAVGGDEAEKDLDNGTTPSVDSGRPSTPPSPGNDGGTPMFPPDDASSAPETEPPPPPPPPPPTLEQVKDLALTEIAVFQGVKLTIAKDGAKADTTHNHVVAGREALIRAYVKPSATWTAREVIGRLTLKSDGKEPVVMDTTKSISAASTDAALNSTINFDVPAGAIETSTKYSVELLTKPGQPAGAVTAPRYPATGEESLESWDTGEALKIKLVPVRVNGYVPDTSEAQLKNYRDALYQMYPARKIEITVREVYAYTGSMGAGGSGIGGLLNAITKLRQTDGAPKDVYYYGAFNASSSYSAYCSGGCTTGLCHLVTSNTDTFNRACVGVGYTGKSSAGTLAHEIGHAHGLPHAPCGGVAGPDPKYPYTGAKLGSWGYDLLSKTLIDPAGKSRDFMSYCGPEWISDYNFDRILHRMNSITKAMSIYTPPGTPMTYRFVEVRPDGSLAWGDTVTVDEPLLAEPHTITYETSAGKSATATGFYYPFQDMEGGTLMIPEVAGTKAIEVSGMAKTVQSRLVRTF